jgi:hypothetical protein
MVRIIVRKMSKKALGKVLRFPNVPGKNPIVPRNDI